MFISGDIDGIRMLNEQDVHLGDEKLDRTKNNGGVFNFKKNSYTIDPSWYEIVYKVGW